MFVMTKCHCGNTYKIFFVTTNYVVITTRVLKPFEPLIIS